MKRGKELEEHILSTYFSLRWGMVVIAIGSPLILAGLGYLLFQSELQDSLSAYYGTGMRDFFVGALCATGACLYLYKGFSTEENIVLNCAGTLAVGTALFPWTWNPWGERVTPHGICAVLFFLGIAWVCLRCAKDTLRLVTDEGVRTSFERKYKVIGSAMAASPVIAYLVNVFLPEPYRGYTFWAEVAAIAVFAAYWVTKSLELARTSAEERVVKGSAAL